VELGEELPRNPSVGNAGASVDLAIQHPSGHCYFEEAKEPIAWRRNFEASFGFWNSPNLETQNPIWQKTLLEFDSVLDTAEPRCYDATLREIKYRSDLKMSVAFPIP
jgi:hypothetical protein